MKPLLVATDDGRMTTSALSFAATYGTERRVPVEVVAFVEPLSDLPMPLPHRDELEEAHARGVDQGIRTHIRDTVGATNWPVHVRMGRPAPVIATVARERDAGMILLAVDPNGTQGSAIAVELLHLTDQPVLFVHGGALPRIAVVGVDFSEASTRAAKDAARLVGPDGVIHLVHVKPSLDFPAASVWGWEPCYACAVDTAFDRLARQLADDGAGSVERHYRSGEPVQELLAAAEEVDADLLAAGSDGYMCDGRVVVGRVARRLVAEATISVLAMPVTTSINGPFAPPASVRTASVSAA
jgi:nucleotide-binding universal stress UspA family protein